MYVLWINAYEALASVVNSDTTWVKFTSLLALFQRGGPAVLYAVICSFTVTLNPFGRTVDFSFSYCCTRNKITSGCTTLEISGDKPKSPIGLSPPRIAWDKKRLNKLTMMNHYITFSSLCHYFRLLGKLLGLLNVLLSCETPLVSWIPGVNNRPFNGENHFLCWTFRWWWSGCLWGMGGLIK